MKRCVFLAAFFLFMCTGITVYASEEPYPDVGERVNHMEIRLEEYGTNLAEIEQRLASAETEAADAELQRLTLSQQLDVVILGLDSVNEQMQVLYSKILELEKNQADFSSRSVSSLSDLNNTADSLLKVTVSGNVAMSDMGQSLMESIEANSEMSVKELTETLSATNTVLIKLYCILFALIVIIIADVLYRLLWNRLFKHAFDS